MEVDFKDAVIVMAALTLLPTDPNPERENRRKALIVRVDTYIREELSRGEQLDPGRERPE